jgi:hypothetical protein
MKAESGMPRGELLIFSTKTDKLKDFLGKASKVKGFE